MRMRGNLKYYAMALLAVAVVIMATSGRQYAQEVAKNILSRKLEVILKAPQGSTEGSASGRPRAGETLEIMAGFNQPMTALEAAPQDMGNGPLILEPPVKGKYRWRGTTVLVFIPQDTLPFSTEYKVRIPAGTKALSGAVLDKDVVWTFETPRPTLLSTVPYYQQHFVELDHSVAFVFNQPMDPAKAQKYFKIEEDDRKGRKTDLPFTVRTPTTEEAKKIGAREANILLMVPQSKYQRQRTIRVGLQPGLQGAQGPQGLFQQRSIEFYTYNPFSFGWATPCKNADPEGWIHFHFSNPVERKEFIKNIVITPPVQLPKIGEQGQIEDDDYYGGYGDSVQTLNLRLKPESRYEVKISGQMKDRFDQVLGRDTSFAITTGSYHPYFFIPGGVGVIESYGDLKLPVTTMNWSAVRRRAALIPASKVVPLLKDRNALSSWAEDFAYQDSIKWGISGTWRFNIKPNFRRTLPFDLKQVLGKQPYGFVYLDLDSLPPWGGEEGNWAYDNRRHDRAFLQVTGLGLTGKFSPENNLIWVTDLKTGAPVPGAGVVLRDDNNRILFSGQTDSTGCLMAPGWGRLGLKQKEPADEDDYYYSQRPRIWVFAGKGQDRAMMVSDWGMGIEPYEFGLSYDWDPKPVQYRGHVFTERGLYKAGEKVFIKGVFREKRQGQWAVPSFKTLTLTIRDSRGDQMAEKKVKLSDWGAFEYTLDLKSEAPSGYYSIKAKNSKVSGYGSFRVEAFKPAQFEVTASSDRSEYLAGENFSGKVLAKYLFGSPMSKEKASWALRLEPYQFTPPGHEGYSFGSYWWWDDYRDQSKLLASRDSLLDERGEIKATAKLDLKDYKSSGALTLEGTVTNVSRQSQSGRCQAIVHRGEFYIGLKQNKGFLEPKDTLKLELITVKPGGENVPDQQLMVKIIKREWRSVRRAGSGGRYEWITEKSETDVKRFDLTTGKEPQQISYRPEAPGFYLVRAMGVDGKGNRVITDGDFYATGSGYVAWERRDDDRIDLVADKSGYKPGDMAKIMIKSPYQKARALITVEREFIIQRWVQEVEGSAPTIELPIKTEHLPNIFVSVILVQGRLKEQKYSDEGDDLSKPSFKIGYLNLPVDPGDKRLEVEVKSDKENYRPRDSVAVTVDVKNSKKQGALAEVVLAVVDKGVLNLIDFKTPNSFDAFYGLRPLSVATAETRLHVVGQRNYGEKGENRGGGGGLEADFRGEFLTTAYYNAKLLTDSTGHAVIKFRLPDNLTTFKIMATAQTKASEFGAAENSFLVNKPILLLEALPRFLRLGDVFLAGVAVHNKTGSEQTVEVTATVENLKLQGQSEKQIRVPPNQAQELVFDYQAGQLGTAVFRFAAKSQAGNDGLEIKIPVRMPKLMEAVALYSQAEGQALEAVKVPEKIMPGMGDLTFTASSTALSGLESSLDYLIDYPYGCLEQRLSKILPMISAEQMVKDFNLAPLKGRNIKKIVKKELREVPQFQLSDGGFSFWKEGWYRISSPYLTAYAMTALYRARAAGYEVDQNMVDRALEYLRAALGRMGSRTDWQWPYSTSIQYTCLSYVSYALALWGQPDASYLHRLYDKRDQMSYFGKAMLLRALHLKGGDAAMEQELARSLVNKIKLSSTSAHFEEDEDRSGTWIFQSNVRTTALILTTLLEAGGSFEHSEKVIRWLTNKRKKGRWNNTQDNIYVFEAFKIYYDLYEKQEPNFTASLKLENKQILKELFAGRSMAVKKKVVPLSKLTKGKELSASVSKQGTGRLYYGIRMTYAPQEPAKMRDEGLAVFKQIVSLKTLQPVKEYKAGEIYKITLSVVTPYERNYVVLDDPLPAGFEAVNTSFATESREMQRRMQQSEPEDGEYRRWWGSFNHFETYDDRVLLFADDLLAGEHTHSYFVRASTPGTFYLPSTKAEEMYNPDVFGWCEDRVITIK
jgi:uncharacterized protein YfaS (alpha-2-macroglobulin family)